MQGTIYPGRFPCLALGIKRRSQIQFTESPEWRDASLEDLSPLVRGAPEAPGLLAIEQLCPRLRREDALEEAMASSREE